MPTTDNAGPISNNSRHIEVPCCGGTLRTDRATPYRSRFVLDNGGPPVQFTLRWPDGKQTSHSIMTYRTVETGKSFTVVGCRPATHQGRPSALHNIEVDRTENGDGSGYDVWLKNGYAGNYVLATFRLRDLGHPTGPHDNEYSVVLAPGRRIVVAYDIPDKWQFLGLVDATYDPDPASDVIWPPEPAQGGTEEQPDSPV